MTFKIRPQVEITHLGLKFTALLEINGYFLLSKFKNLEAANWWHENQITVLNVKNITDQDGIWITVRIRRTWHNVTILDKWSSWTIQKC